MSSNFSRTETRHEGEVKVPDKGCLQLRNKHQELLLVFYFLGKNIFLKFSTYIFYFEEYFMGNAFKIHNGKNIPWSLLILHMNNYYSRD